ncbi:hypothetical protein TWF718_001260 [Orbilia javanica]|uniref:Uncharacterized protein n=1 Tax=Orbilia javanica TaxID=47235 RepID=A0AAN8RML9_9PEZI
MSGASSSGGLDGGDVLKRLSTGNKREDLPKNLSMISIMGLSFAIMGTAPPCTYTPALGTMWTFGDIGAQFNKWRERNSIAASLAEICAVYPTAGGVYYANGQLDNGMVDFGWKLDVSL